MIEIYGSGGAREVPLLEKYTREAFFYSFAFGTGALLRVHFDKHYPDKIAIGGNQDLEFIETMQLFNACGKIPILYVDEAPAWANQVSCVETIVTAAKSNNFGCYIFTSVPGIARAAITAIEATKQVSYIMVGLLAGNLLERGIDPVNAAQDIDSLAAVAIWGHEFSWQIIQAIANSGFIPFVNIRNDYDPEKIRTIVASGAKIICYDPRAVAAVVG